MEDLEKKLWKKARRYVGLMRWIPGLKMVAVCNTLAFGKVNEDSDIDLFIVAKKGRLFTVRILTVFLFQVLGVRMHGGKIAGRFCLSFLVDDSHLSLEDVAIENDIYLAFWVKSMIPLIDDGVSEDFLRENAWVERFFEENDGLVLEKGEILRKGLFSRIFSTVLGWFLGAWFENLMKNWQLKRAKRRSGDFGPESSIIVRENILKFHHRDRRSLYRGRFQEKFGDSKLTKERFLSL